MDILKKHKLLHGLLFLSIPALTIVLAYLLQKVFLSIIIILFFNIYFSYKYRRLKETDQNFFKPLNLVAYSFLFFYMLQSPIFPSGFYVIEISYFVLKLFSILLISILLFKKDFFIASNIILCIHFLDSIFIRFINLDLVKSPTEYYSIFEFTTCLYFFSFLSFYLINKRPSVKSTLRASVLISFCIFALANYWAAGQAKLLLDGGALSWLNNETFLTASRAKFWGLNVISFSVLQDYYIYEILQQVGNFIVLFTQVTVPIVFLWSPLIIIYSLFFELFHILVGLAAGVWFYKWMWVTSIIIFLRKDISRQLKYRTNKFIKLSLLIFMFISPSFMTMEPLAWYEIRQGDVIRAFGNENNERYRLHQQFFGSASFPILAKYSYRAFEYGAHFEHHATESYANKELAKYCGFKKIKNANYNHINKSRLEEITLRLLEERSVVSKVLINIQPFHIVVPNLSIDTSLIGKEYESVTFENYSICFDKKGQIIKTEELDKFTIFKSGPERNLAKPYFIWIEDKINRMSDKNFLKIPLNRFFNYIKNR